MPDHAQTIAYPAPGSRPHRRDLDALAPHVIVLFGATGDLAKRKLMPGLAYLDQSAIAPEIRVVGTSLEDISTEDFRALARKAVDAFGTHKIDENAWTKFSQKLTYVPQSAGPEGLTAAVKAAEIELGPNVRLLHYLSVPPKAAARGDHHARRRRPGRQLPGGDGEAVRHRPGHRRSS